MLMKQRLKGLLREEKNTEKGYTKFMADNNKFQVSPEELDQAIAQPVAREAKQMVAEVGQALEMGAQSTTDPAIQAKKQQEEDQKTAKGKKYWQDFLSKFKEDAQKLKMEHQQEDQKVAQEEQEAQKKVEILQFEKRKKQESFEVQHIKGLQAKTEMKKGVGG